MEWWMNKKDKMENNNWRWEWRCRCCRNV